MSWLKSLIVGSTPANAETPGAASTCCSAPWSIIPASSA
jgi:hypothetical protein